jgi:hypothetical protein
MGDPNAPLRRKQNNKVFLPGELDDPSDILRYIATPEPHVMRVKARNAFKRGEMPQKQIECPHDISKIDLMTDDTSDAHRIDRPTNYFVCRMCGATLFLVDGSGKSASDG